MMVRAKRGWPKPQVPVQTIRDRFDRTGPIEPLRPERAARPVNNLFHRADGPGGNPFTQPASILGRLIAYGHLSGHTCLSGDFRHAPRFINGMGHRLLAEDMLASLHRSHRDGRMEM